MPKVVTNKLKMEQPGDMYNAFKKKKEMKKKTA